MYNNLDVVFLSGLFPKNAELEIINNSIGNIQLAANNLQWGIVEGLDANLEKPVKIINSLYIGSFPKRYKKLNIDTFDFSHINDDSLEDINVGFLNIPGIKNVSRYLSLKPYLRKWAKSKNTDKKIVIAYAMTSTFTHLLQYVKKYNKNVKTCLIVPDLPQYMNLTNESKIYNILKSIEIRSIKYDMEYIDSYVLLTKYMQQVLNIKVPSIVMEGISTNLFENVPSFEKEEGIKTILYSGGLTEKYGIIDLIQAFQRLSDENYRLIICGSGSAEPDIKKASLKDKRIIFKGLLNREEVFKLQKFATVLVNPRTNNEEYTKYSFPSKIMEYMSSGTPVIAYKLDGMPREYFDYIYPVNNHSDGLLLAIREVMSKSEKELREKGFKAKEFVLNQKSSFKQAERILKLISSL